ncbi:MAG: VCBS repeat-containing protein [Weeksellaceae bacterium]|nr:VCBS repeat-containing protein [Weeksellaceae bacterium]
MKKYIDLYFLLIPFVASAQQRGFRSMNDMNADEPRFSFGATKQRSASISLADINNDGKMDAVVANGRHWPETNYIFYNSGKGFNVMKPLDNVSSSSYAAKLVDLDNDKDLDIIEINDNAPHRIYTNDGLGNFQFLAEVGEVSNARNVSLGDLDHNGFIDFIITNRGQQNMICYNNGKLNFDCVKLQTKQNSTIDIAIQDLDGDSLPDLILANRDHVPNEILISKGHRQFEKKLDFGTGTFETRSVAIADINNDGYLDIVTGNINAANVIYLGDKNFTFTETVLFGSKDIDTYSIALADFNKDGFMDIVTGNYQKPNTVFLNVDGKNFEEINLTDRSSRTYNVTVGDINSDGWIDIAVANSDDFNLYYLNTFQSKK